MKQPSIIDRFDLKLVLSLLIQLLKWDKYMCNYGKGRNAAQP